MACPPDNHHETVSSCDLHFLSGDDKDEELLSQWHRDIAYRLLTDHSRALTYALADGLLPGRQGLPLKLRQLIQRAVRAAVLTGLERERTGSSLLSSLVTEVAKQANLMEASVSTELQGPSARQPSSLSYEEMRSVIDHEVHAFIPRIHDMELAFGRCLEESPNTTQLSAQQVDGLMNGKYGTPVSWDLLCAQSRWFGLCIPDVPAQSRGSRTSSRHSINTQQPVSLPRHFHNASIPFTVDSAKYNYTKSSDQSYGEFDRVMRRLSIT
ncbi:unnamed protein product [Dicrocoelium dendriticum]|nr:unnamed protein product [Dicrocoelium dendriticum]